MMICCFILIARPFDTTKGNVIEIVNELIYTVLSLSLFYLNNKSAWQKSLQYVYIALIISCSAITGLITFVDLIFKAIKKYLQWKNKKNKVTSEVKIEKTDIIQGNDLSNPDRLSIVFYYLYIIYFKIIPFISRYS
jgi:hypothetical protein